VITFDEGLFDNGLAILTLTYDDPPQSETPDQLLINSSVTIEGPGAELLSMSGGLATRVFEVSRGVTATQETRAHFGGEGQREMTKSE
jgi:hypothetical protein